MKRQPTLSIAGRESSYQSCRPLKAQSIRALWCISFLVLSREIVNIHVTQRPGKSHAHVLEVVNDLAPKLTGELRGIRVCDWGASRAREQKLRDASCVKALIGPGELAIVAIVLGSRGVQETESSGFGGGLSSSTALVLACAESCAFLGILFYLFSPYHSPTTGTSFINNSSDLFILHK